MVTATPLNSCSNKLGGLIYDKEDGPIEIVSSLGMSMTGVRSAFW